MAILNKNNPNYNIYSRVPICFHYKIIKAFRQYENNSVPEIAKKLSYKHADVNFAINCYLKPKVLSIKKD